MLSLKNIAQSKLVRNSAKLISANAIAQAIGLLVYPILSRLYTPEDFGLLNLFLGIGGLLVLLSTAEYQYAILLPKEERKSKGAFQVALLQASLKTRQTQEHTILQLRRSFTSSLTAGLILWYAELARAELLRAFRTI